MPYSIANFFIFNYYFLQNANIVHAVLTLVKELDAESLETVVTACKDRLETL